MGSNKCSRCGRDRPAQSHTGNVAATAVPLPFYDAREAAWMSIDGADVCPVCQTADERRDADRAVVAAIESEIERRQRSGMSPDPYEAALVAYAMTIRSRGTEHAHRVPTTAPSTSEESLGQSQSRCLRVAFTGAFLTGHPLSIRIGEYEAVQEKLHENLESSHWRTKDLLPDGRTFEAGGGFSRPMPLVIARRRGTDLTPALAEALGGRGCAGASKLDRFAPLTETHPSSLTIDVYDLGVAVMTAWFDVVATKDAALADIAAALKRLARLRNDKGRSPLVVALQDIADETTRQYGKAVMATASHKVARLSGSSARGTSAAVVDSPDESGQLLWLHPVNVLYLPEPTDGNARAEFADRAAEDARELAPTFREEIRLGGGYFAAGIGSSAVVVANKSDAELTPLRLTELHWAYIALYMQIDRGLLGVLNQERWSRPAPLKKLEAEAEEVFLGYKRVADARARLDSELSGRGGDEIAIWETIAKVQKFDTIVGSVDRKLEALEKVARRRVEEATASRARRMAAILGMLTVLTVVTVAASVIGTVWAWAEPDGDRGPRIAILILASGVSVLLFWLAFLRTMRVPGPEVRPRP